MILAALIGLLKFLEFRYIVRALSLELYMGLLAVFFTAVGVWTGLKLTRKKQIVLADPQVPFSISEENVKNLGISKRELEVLELIAAGLTNQEIADKLFVSLNTIKTHSSNLFIKLEVKRRTQALQRAKTLHLIP